MVPHEPLRFLRGKTLLLIRHGQASHNVFLDLAWKSHGDDRISLRANGYSLHDPLLTEEGVDQAHQLRGLMAGTHIDLIVSSPLRRALMTADVGFPTVARRVVQPTIRERCGGVGRLCDTGLGRQASMACVRSDLWEWGLLPEAYGQPTEQPLRVTEDDVRHGKVDESRETVVSVRDRVLDFAEYIATLPAGSTIAAVGHGDFWQSFTAHMFSQPIRLGNCGVVVCDASGVRDAYPGFGSCCGISHNYVHHPHVLNVHPVSATGAGGRASEGLSSSATSC